MTDEPTADRDVLHSLPRTRPARRSAKRDAPARPPAKATAAAARTGPTKPKPAAAKPKAARSGPRLTPPPPTPPRASAPPASGYAVPEPDPHPRSGDLLSATVAAAAEIAHLGLRLAGRTLRAVLEHRPGSGD